MKKNAERFLTALYCDDIRHEMGNKLSFMGCYQGELIVPVAPTLLNKLCVYASATTPVEKPFRNLVFRVVQDDDKELARVDIHAEALDGVSQIREDGATRAMLSTALIFAPFFIEKPTSLRLMAITEEGEIVGPRLRIRVATPVSSPSLSAEEPKAAAPYVSTKRKPAAKKKTTSTRTP